MLTSLFKDYKNLIGLKVVTGINPLIIIAYTNADNTQWICKKHPIINGLSIKEQYEITLLNGDILSEEIAINYFGYDRPHLRYSSISNF